MPAPSTEVREDFPKSGDSLEAAATMLPPAPATKKTKRSKIAPPRDEMPSFESFGMIPAEGVFELASDNEALAAAYGEPSVRAILSNGLVFGAAIAACVGGLLFGFDQGLVSITLVMPTFLARFPEIDSSVSSSAGFMKGLLTALLELGALLGALQAGFISDKISRRYTIAVGICWFCLGSIIQTASFSYGTLVAGRTIGGVGIGMLSTTAPTYISEIAPPNLRGTLLVAEDIAIVLGICLFYYVTYGTRLLASEWSFRLPFLLQMVPAWILAGVLFVIPFSPRWLAQQGRDEECLEVLCRLRRKDRSDALVQAEFLSIRSEACYAREVVILRHPSLQGDDFLSSLKLELAAWADCFRAGTARRTWIGIGLMWFQQFCGINALIYFSPTLFESLGYDYETQLNFSGIFNIVQLVAVCTALITLDRIGRRPPLLAGSILMTISHLIVAVMIGLYASDWPGHLTEAKVGVAFIMLFCFFYGLGWGPVPWTVPSEIHSTSSRAKGVALSVATNWLGNFIIGLITPPLIEASAMGTFVFFGGWSLLSFVFAFFFVPETKGRSLEDMDALFKTDTAARDAQEKALILGKLTGQDTSTALFDRHQDKRAIRGAERRFEYA